MNNTSIILSVLVISHNQRELLGRCLESILAQKICNPWEIVISDDRSSDGTWELIQEYCKNYPTLIFGYRCNSDECNPVNLSERCGWNKLNAWSHARGKYMVNIDADDYLKSDDIYQLQIDALENHPNCSMCQQRVWQLDEGSSLSTGYSWPEDIKLFEGAIISPVDAVIGNIRGVNPCYMMRRRKEDNMRNLYGKHYDDTIITLHNLQYGPVIFVDRSDYVWIQYKGSISHTIKKEEEMILYGMLPLHHCLFIPKLAGLLLYGGLQDLIHMFKVTPERMSMTKSSIDFLKEFDGFLYKYYSSQNHSLWSRLRYKWCRLSLLICKKFNLHSPMALRYLYTLMINRESAYAIRKEYWKVDS